jgi:hypothetical protein
MENKKIAELVAKKIYNFTENETDFAVQLLVEKLVMPDNVNSYTAADAEKYILGALTRNHPITQTT